MCKCGWTLQYLDRPIAEDSINPSKPRIIAGLAATSLPISGQDQGKQGHSIHFCLPLPWKSRHRYPVSHLTTVAAVFLIPCDKRTANVLNLPLSGPSPQQLPCDHPTATRVSLKQDLPCRTHLISPPSSINLFFLTSHLLRSNPYQTYYTHHRRHPQFSCHALLGLSWT